MDNDQRFRERHEWTGAFTSIAFVLGTVLALMSSGCFALAAGAAGGAAGAVYVLGKLTEEVNHEVPVVHEAAVHAIKDVGLKLSEDRADRLSAHLESEFSDGTKVWIDMKAIAENRTKLVIRVGVTGDEARARKINDTIKRRLPHGVS